MNPNTEFVEKGMKVLIISLVSAVSRPEKHISAGLIVSVKEYVETYAKFALMIV